MAEIRDPNNIFQPRLSSGAIAANAVTILGQPVNINRALSKAIGTSFAQIVDTVNISAGARVAEEIHTKDAALTGSDKGPVGIQGAHPIINGIANLEASAKKLASGT